MTLAEEIQYHANIRSELPALLTQLINEGKQDDAIRLLKGWGTHEMKNSEIWTEAKQLLKEVSA